MTTMAHTLLYICRLSFLFTKHLGSSSFPRVWQCVSNSIPYWQKQPAVARKYRLTLDRIYTQGGVRSAGIWIYHALSILCWVCVSVLLYALHPLVKSCACVCFREGRRLLPWSRDLVNPLADKCPHYALLANKAWHKLPFEWNYTTISSWINSGKVFSATCSRSGERAFLRGSLVLNVLWEFA